MNNEKVEALFNSIELQIDEQKKATHELKRATNAAVQLKKANSENENISKVVDNFRAVQTNSGILKEETSNAINRIEHIAKWQSILTHLLLLIATFGIGITGSYAFWEYEIKPRIIADIVKESEEKGRDDYQKLVELHFGVTVRNDGIRLKNGSFSKSQDGRYYIPSLDK